MGEEEIELLLGRGGGDSGGGLGNDCVCIGGKKLVPDGVRFCGGSEGGGNQGEPAGITRSCEGNNICYATFR